MEQIRASMGAEAIILSTQKEADGQVLVTAALEGEPLDHTDGPVGDKINVLEAIERALEFHRVPSNLSDGLLQDARPLTHDDRLSALAGALERHLTFASANFVKCADPIMLVGLPGTGKTAIAAKIGLAARLAERPFRLITMDGAKTGGMAQAEGFANSLGAELREAQSPDELRRVVAAAPAGALVLIDTPGHNPFRAASLAGLSILLEASSAEAIQVIAAGGDSAEAAEIAHAFRRVGARRMIVTKLDLARRLGGLLSAASNGGGALAAITDAPEVTGGLTEVTPQGLAELLLNERCDGSHERPGTRVA